MNPSSHLPHLSGRFSTAQTNQSKLPAKWKLNLFGCLACTALGPALALQHIFWPMRTNHAVSCPFCAEKSATLCHKKKCYWTIWTLVCICLHVSECHQVSSLGGIIGHLQELRNQQICRDPQLEELIQPLETMHFTCRCWIMNGPTEISDQLNGVADRRRNANSVRYLYPLWV